MPVILIIVAIFAVLLGGTALAAFVDEREIDPYIRYAVVVCVCACILGFCVQQYRGIKNDRYSADMARAEAGYAPLHSKHSAECYTRPLHQEVIKIPKDMIRQMLEEANREADPTTE